jgi:hypothetical protein
MALRTLVATVHRLASRGIHAPGSRPLTAGTARVLLSVLLLGCAASAHSKNWYVYGAVSSSGDGQSWASAWKAPSNINWASVRGGDTIYIGAGSYGALTIGASGSSASRITVRAAQETRIGLARFSSISYAGYDYVTIDGGYAGARNFATSGSVNAQNTTRASLRYLTATSPLDFRYAANAEIAYNLLDIVGTQHETTAYMIAASHSASAYGQASFHHNTVRVAGKINNGTGPDGIQTGTGYDIYNNTFQAVNDNSYSGGQHQDLIQAYGDNYLRVYNNTFIDSGDSQFDFSASAGTRSHLYFYNNVLVRTISGMGTVGLRIYSTPTTLRTLSDIHIFNNTFADCSRTTSAYGAAIRVQDTSSASYSDVQMKNNIFFNCGKGWPAVLIEGRPSGWDGSNNLVNAGSGGNTNISGMPNANGQSGTPQFVSYSAYSLGNDYMLGSSDAAARDRATNLSTYFTTDKAGATRGSAWDIGAYEVGGGSEQTALPAPSNMRVISQP